MRRLVDRLLARVTRLPHVGGRGWKAICPLANGDRDHVLKIDLTPTGQVLIFCHNLCPTPDVLASLNLRERDLYPVRPGPGRGRQGPAPSLTVKLRQAGLSDDEIAQAMKTKTPTRLRCTDRGQLCERSAPAALSQTTGFQADHGGRNC